MFAQLLVQEQIKENIKLRFTGLCAGISPVTGEFHAEKTSNAEKFPFDDVITFSIVLYFIPSIFCQICEPP